MKFIKLLFLSTLCISLLSISHTANALDAQESTQQKNKKLLEDIRKDQLDEHDKDRKDRAKQTEEQTNATTSQTGQLAKHDDANNLNAAKLAGENAAVRVHDETMNLDQDMCSFVSVQQGFSRVVENAAKVTEELRKARNADYFTNSERGLVDFQNELYEQMKSLPPERVDLGILFSTPIVPNSGVDATNLAYLEKLLFQRVPVAMLKDLKDNPDTEVKNSLVTADRIAAESRIGSSLMSILQGTHAPTPGVNGAKWAGEIMQANGYNPEYIQKVLGGNQPSKFGLLESLTVGQIGSEYSKDKLVMNSENYGGAILFQLMISNMLAFEQYRLLETIAMSSAANLITNREEAIKDINTRFSKKNSRQ